ncbi:MAG: DUF2851 family protein [Kiritimatiellae bacterium]|nr:DUF2851 family protein [Kiritimatiellia bacterium]
MTSTPFHLADDYARMLTVPPSAAHEDSARYRSGFHWSERHLQCLWFDERYRPAFFRLSGGETATVLDPGQWNLEAGPDFLNATLLLQPGERQLRGDVEIHVHPSDWDTHNHRGDPAYDRLIAHVTWFSGPPPRTLPPGVCPISLAEPVLSHPGLSLGDIDLKAYPHAVLPVTPRPCEAFLRNDPDRARTMLASAGHYRLRLKADRIRTRLEQSGDRNQVFYEEVMAALGFKHNQMPFRALARLIPLASLGVRRETAFARLLGAARLLPQPEAAPDNEGQHFIRTLWDSWWRDSIDTLPANVAWRLHNLRPQNSPVRRLAASASLFSGMASVLNDLDRLSGLTGLPWYSHAQDAFTLRCRWPFWNQRLAFSSTPDQEHDIALLGESRVAAILTNVVFPFYAAENRFPADAFEYLPPEDLSAPMRLTALHLFGRDHNPALYSDSGLLQQGLLQIHLDFCLTAKPGCDSCTLCQTLAGTA